MAIFEKKFERKLIIDDTEPISCKIETSQTINGHTEYVLKVQRGPLQENSWRLLRRYNDFVELQKCLQISGISLPLPAKKFIGNMRPEFIAERKIALQEYINIILMNPILASSLMTRRFVDPDVYNQSFLEIAIQNATLCLRTEGIHTLGQSHGAIGWRLRKHYFKVGLKSAPQGKNSPSSSTSSSSSSTSTTKLLVKSGSQSSKSGGSTSNGCSDTNGSNAAGSQQSATSQANQSADMELLLSWIEYGPDKYIDDREMHNIFKTLASIQHPYIAPIEYCASNDAGAMIIRKFHHRGTLKDMLCGSMPKNLFLTKYGNPKGRAPLPIKDVALYGRQILEAIIYLHSKGMPYGHCHAGNVIIVDGVARLLDYENFILGVPSFYRPFFMQHSKIHTAEMIDVYSFGHLMYELSFGYSLQESITRQPIDCSESLKQLLESILSKEACKIGLPTLHQLSEHKFFTEHAPRFTERHATLMSNQLNNKPHFKFSTIAKEQLKIAVQRTEQRLRDEQKSAKNQKRLVRVQELMSSEEEKKKIKQKAKLEHKQSKLRQQNSLQLNATTSATMSPLLTRSDSIDTPTTSPMPSSSIQLLKEKQISLPSTAPQPPPPPPSTTAGGSNPIVKPSASVTDELHERSALLDSISTFNKSALRKVVSSSD